MTDIFLDRVSGAEPQANYYRQLVSYIHRFSALMTAAVGLTALAHAEMVPSKVSKMKLALLPGVTGNDPLPMMQPVGVPVLLALLGAGGTAGAP